MFLIVVGHVCQVAQRLPTSAHTEQSTQKCGLCRKGRDRPDAPSALRPERSSGACRRLSAIQFIGWWQMLREDNIQSIFSSDLWTAISVREKMDWMVAVASRPYHPFNCFTRPLDHYLCKVTICFVLFCFISVGCILPSCLTARYVDVECRLRS